MNPIQTIRENAERIAASGMKGPQGCADRILAALAELEKQEPMFWVRLCSDGMYEGPIHNAQIERVRAQSGAWSPLFLGAAPVAQQPQAEAVPLLTDPKQTIERQFAEFLNDRRNMNVSAVFHDLMGKFSALSAPQQAEAVPDSKEKEDARLFYDPNVASDGQQRNLDGAVAMGQHVGAGPDAGTGDIAAEGAVAVIQGVDEYGPLIGWYRHWSELQDGTKLFAAPQQVEAVPPTHVLVPVEPTDEMEVAAENAYESQGWPFPNWKTAYRAMLAAAPK